jgi:hypothetical protein
MARRRGFPETRTGESTMIARALERCQMRGRATLRIGASSVWIAGTRLGLR